MTLFSGENCPRRTLIRYERKILCDIYSEIKMEEVTKREHETEGKKL